MTTVTIGKYPVKIYSQPSLDELEEIRNEDEHRSIRVGMKGSDNVLAWCGCEATHDEIKEKTGARFTYHFMIPSCVNIQDLPTFFETMLHRGDHVVAFEEDSWSPKEINVADYMAMMKKTQMANKYL